MASSTSDGFRRQGVSRNPPQSNRKRLPCEECGRPVEVDQEAVACSCWRCLTRVAVKLPPEPKDCSPRLRAFVRAMCATFDHQHEACLLRDACAVYLGGRCAWFEKAVLPLADREPERFGAASTAYLKQALLLGFRGASTAGANRCNSCGAAIAPRRRLCDVCRERRRKASYRVSRRRKRRKGGDGG